MREKQIMDSLLQFNDVKLKTAEFENSPSCLMDPKFCTSKPSVNEKTGQSFDFFSLKINFWALKTACCCQHSGLTMLNFGLHLLKQFLRHILWLASESVTISCLPL